MKKTGKSASSLEKARIVGFASEGDSESTLREALAECEELEVWQGGVRAAAAAQMLGTSKKTDLMIVDIDEATYPIGAIYELAASCEIGTKVVGFGTSNSGQLSRQLLLAGVEDYLSKPLRVEAVRECVREALSEDRRTQDQGILVGVFGPRGTGKTTIAAATALTLSKKGTYVSVLDLNRSFSALSFALDVDPPNGLVELLSTVARASVHPEMVDAVKGSRGERLAVYGYTRTTDEIPAAPAWAICELTNELQRRSHVVLIEGFDDPSTHQNMVAIMDHRIMVYEGTQNGAEEAARSANAIAMMRSIEWPVIEVQNHTRSMNPTQAQALLEAKGVKPDITVPYEPTLPQLNDDGWSGQQMPRRLRAPMQAIAASIMGVAMSDQAQLVEPAPSQGENKRIADAVEAAAKDTARRVNQWRHAVSDAVRAKFGTADRQP